MGIQALPGVPWKASFYWSAVWPLWPIVQFWNDAGEGAHTSRVSQMSRSALAMTGVTDVIVTQLSYTSDCSFHSQSPSSFTYSYLAAEEKCSHWEILSASAVNVTPLCYYFIYLFFFSVCVIILEWPGFRWWNETDTGVCKSIWSSICQEYLTSFFSSPLAQRQVREQGRDSFCK